jgi:hypothetical protein
VIEHVDGRLLCAANRAYYASEIWKYKNTVTYNDYLVAQTMGWLFAIEQINTTSLDKRSGFVVKIEMLLNFSLFSASLPP